MPPRPYRDEDAEATVAFFASAGALDDSLEPPSLGEWATYTSRSFNAGARDFAVVEVEGEIVAILMSNREKEGASKLRNARIIVHPAHRRRGIATALVKVVDAQDDPPDTTLQTSCMGAWTAGTALVKKHGFSPERSLQWMSIGAPPPLVDPPTGVTLRPYACGEHDDAAWTQLNDEGYRGGPDYSPLLAEDLAALRSEPGFELLVAERDETIVGFCHSKGLGGRPLVNSIVTSSACRGQGIGRALLSRALHDLGSSADRRVRLNVLDKNAHAVALYRSLGFTTDDTITTWWKER